MLLVTRRTLALGVDDGERETHALGKPRALTADPLAGLLLGRPCRKRARQRHNRDPLIATVLDAYRRRRTPAARRAMRAGGVTGPYECPDPFEEALVQRHALPVLSGFAHTVSMPHVSGSRS